MDQIREDLRTLVSSVHLWPKSLTVLVKLILYTTCRKHFYRNSYCIEIIRLNQTEYFLCFFFLRNSRTGGLVLIRFCVGSVGLRISSRANGLEFFCLAYICHAILFFGAEVIAGVLLKKMKTDTRFGSTSICSFISLCIALIALECLIRKVKIKQ